MSPMHTLTKALASLSAFAALLAAAPAAAQPYPVPPTWGGDLDTRPRLTGDWGGTRDEWAKKGFVWDEDLYWWPQAIVAGGKEQTGGNWGNLVTSMHLDTGKAGMWRGGYFKLKAVTSFGHNIYPYTGALVPPNEGWALPSLQAETGLQDFSLLQLLSPKFGVMVGKMDLSVSPNVFSGDYRTGFSSTSLNLPLASALVPLSAFGGGVVYLPNHDVHLSVLVLDPSGTVMDNDIGDAFSDGVMMVGSADVKTHFLGKPGHQNLLLSWSNKERASLVQDPTNIARLLLTAQFPRLGDPGPVLREILEERAPELLEPTVPLNTEQDTWAAVYSGEQFIWQPHGDHAHGLGVFYSAGVSDGRANPIKNSFTLGLVGKGVIKGRPGDNFGIGLSRTEFSDYFMSYLRDRFDLGLDHEDVVELYYSASIKPWLTVTPSIQAVRPALSRTLDADHEFQPLETTWLVGLRVGVRL